MKSQPIISAAVFCLNCLLAACEAPDAASASVPPASVIAGIDLEGMDRNVRPQDNFYEYANGRWLADNVIAADQPARTSFSMLHNRSLTQLKAIIQSAATDTASSAAATKIGDYYRAYMDEVGADSKGAAPLMDLLQQVDALRSHQDLVRFFGKSNELGVDAPFNVFVAPDARNPQQYVVNMVQSGLGLPDRDYYFDNSARGLAIRGQYLQYVQTLLALSGHAEPADSAARIIALETRLASSHIDKVSRRDATARYNKYAASELGELLSNLDVPGYFDGLGAGMQQHVIVWHPAYLQGLNDLFLAVPVATWKDYLHYQALASFADYLSGDFVDATFELYGKTLQGREQPLPRWKRAIDSTNGNLGQLLGRLYVAQHFSPTARARVQVIVDNLLLAYRESITDVEWMSEATRSHALAKLASFRTKIGYPDEWLDYSGLQIRDDDLVGNIQRARRFAHYREIDKLGGPVDRGEWLMPPQRVNAYYNPVMNEIVFPAAILQPPFFILDAEDARNYGAIGMIIGHEIGHGFDDQGSKYAGDGSLSNWWTDDDRSRFAARIRRLVDQFSQFEVLPGLFVNGELTLGENIGDLGGAAIALRAYEMSLGDEESPKLDGMTGRERFFLGMAQAWRALYRPEAMEARVRTDPHAPPVFRVNGVVRNIDTFYETFGVMPGDGHYLQPDDRVRIWR